MAAESAYSHIVVGVDGSDAATEAVAAAARFARMSHAELSLVHATRDYLVAASRALSAAATAVSSSTGPIPDTALVEAERARIAAQLASHLPSNVVHAIHVEPGRAGTVLEKFASEFNADLIVVGGKHHTTIGRWLGGSTARFLAGSATVPLLVTRELTTDPQRILVATDLSDRTPTVLQAADALARTVHAALRVVHVVEPVPGNDDQAPKPGADQEQDVREALARVLSEADVHEGTTHDVFVGEAQSSLRKEIDRWDPDVLVVGSHGAGFQHPHLIGRLTDSFLSDLTTSLLIVPG